MAAAVERGPSAERTHTLAAAAAPGTQVDAVIYHGAARCLIIRPESPDGSEVECLGTLTMRASAQIGELFTLARAADGHAVHLLQHDVDRVVPDGADAARAAAFTFHLGRPAKWFDGTLVSTFHVREAQGVGGDRERDASSGLELARLLAGSVFCAPSTPPQQTLKPELGFKPSTTQELKSQVLSAPEFAAVVDTLADTVLTIGATREQRGGLSRTEFRRAFMSDMLAYISSLNNNTQHNGNSSSATASGTAAHGAGAVTPKQHGAAGGTSEGRDGGVEAAGAQHGHGHGVESAASERSSASGHTHGSGSNGRRGTNGGARGGLGFGLGGGFGMGLGLGLSGTSPTGAGVLYSDGDVNGNGGNPSSSSSSASRSFLRRMMPSAQAGEREAHSHLHGQGQGQGQGHSTVGSSSWSTASHDNRRDRGKGGSLGRADNGRDRDSHAHSLRWQFSSKKQGDGPGTAAQQQQVLQMPAGSGAVPGQAAAYTSPGGGYAYGPAASGADVADWQRMGMEQGGSLQSALHAYVPQQGLSYGPASPPPLPGAAMAAAMSRQQQQQTYGMMEGGVAVGTGMGMGPASSAAAAMGFHTFDAAGALQYHQGQGGQQGQQGQPMFFLLSPSAGSPAGASGQAVSQGQVHSMLDGAATSRAVTAGTTSHGFALGQGPVGMGQAAVLMPSPGAGPMGGMAGVGGALQLSGSMGMGNGGSGGSSPAYVMMPNGQVVALQQQGGAHEQGVGMGHGQLGAGSPGGGTTTTTAGYLMAMGPQDASARMLAAQQQQQLQQHGMAFRHPGAGMQHAQPQQQQQQPFIGSPMGMPMPLGGANGWSAVGYPAQ